MAQRNLYYATNRRHVGSDRWNPKGYSTFFSADGLENLRFGRVTVDVEEGEIKKYLRMDTGFGRGEGEKLSGYMKRCIMNGAKIKAYEENIDHRISDVDQKSAVLGSLAMFRDLKEAMMNTTDVLVYIHGFNVSWEDALAAAFSLQEMLNGWGGSDKADNILVILFTWPSDGRALPYVSYKSDRTDAKNSGYAFGRGLLKVRDFMTKLKKEKLPGGEKPCEQDIHLLCHSMGNYVLQNAIKRIAQFTPSKSLPRLFEHIFLCAPDVDDDVLEADKPMGGVHELCRNVTLYHNREDVAMYVSDYTKGNPDRLGCAGASRPFLLHNKVHQVDCTPVVEGIVEHSYYLCGNVNRDIRLSIDGIPFDLRDEIRARSAELPNV